MKKIICIIALVLPVIVGAQTAKKEAPKEEKTKESMVDITTDFGTMPNRTERAH